MLLMPNNEWSRRVFQEENTIYKFFDHRKLQVPDNHAVVQDLKLLPDFTFQYMTLDKRFSMVTYTFIEGTHTPTNSKEFEGIFKQLHVIHENRLVHGDLRIENVVFNDKLSYLIDFDFMAAEDMPYPIRYNDSLPYRHADAQELEPMRISHDRFSLAAMLLDFFPDQTYVAEQVKNTIPLLDLVQHL